MIGTKTARKSAHARDIPACGNTDFLHVSCYGIAQCICVDVRQRRLQIADHSVGPQFVQQTAVVVVQPIHRQFKIRQVQIGGPGIQHDDLAIMISTRFEPQR